MIELSVGQKYPLPITVKEGASANFLMKGDSVLHIFLPDILPSEIRQIKKGKIKAGIIVDLPLILWVFQFGDMTFECPYDIRLINKNDLELPSITNEKQRLAISMHLVDSNTNIIHALKLFTLSPELSLKFLLAAQEQLVHPEPDITPVYNRYLMQPLENLIKITQLTPCGQN